MRGGVRVRPLGLRSAFPNAFGGLPSPRVGPCGRLRRAFGTFPPLRFGTSRGFAAKLFPTWLQWDFPSGAVRVLAVVVPPPLFSLAPRQVRTISELGRDAATFVAKTGAAVRGWELMSPEFCRARFPPCGGRLALGWTMPLRGEASRWAALAVGSLFVSNVDNLPRSYPR